jgi:hypothetical protein
MTGFVRLISPCVVVAAAFLAFATIDSSQAAAPPTNAEAPVEFTYVGIAPNKTEFLYTIKVNTDKPIKEVPLKLKDLDASGTALTDTTLVWRNIVHSTPQPIEQGKT